MLLESPVHPPVCLLEGPEGQITWEIFYMRDEGRTAVINSRVGK